MRYTFLFRVIVSGSGKEERKHCSTLGKTLLFKTKLRRFASSILDLNPSLKIAKIHPFNKNINCLHQFVLLMHLFCNDVAESEIVDVRWRSSSINSFDEQQLFLSFSS